MSRHMTFNLNFKTKVPLDHPENYLTDEDDIEEYYGGCLETFIKDFISENGVAEVFDWFDYKVEDCKFE